MRALIAAMLFAPMFTDCALKLEFRQIDQDLDVLIAEVRKAIASSDEFIDSLRSE